MSNSPLTFFHRRRRALLGAVAALAIIGGVASSLDLHGPAPRAAHAETTQTVRPSGFADVVARVKPAVVAVIVQQKPREPAASEFNSLPDLSPDDPLYRFFRQFRQEFGHQELGRQRPRAVTAQGSGFFISGDGYLLTNNHVVDGGTSFKIVTDDGKDFTGKLIGRDPRTDLALLKVDADKPFPFVSFSGLQPRVGDWVVAIGNPFGLGGTVTAGIVSARGRDIGAGPYDDFLQIDAPVNRGNSGGPSFNLDGEVVGINTAIFSPSGGSVGIGFAIPSNIAQNVVAQLKKDGAVVRGWLGVQIQPVTEDIASSLGLDHPQGALVADVQHGSPAAKAGIEAGDVVMAINGDPVHDARDLQRRVAALPPGSTHGIELLRKGRKLSLNAEFGKLPIEERQASAAGEDKSSSADLTGLGVILERGAGGVVIASLDPEGAAASHGLHAGDVIIAIGGDKVAKPADVAEKLTEAKKSGRKAVLAHVRSNGKSVFVPLPVAQG